MATKWKEFITKEVAQTPTEMGWEASWGKNSACDDGSPSHAIRQRKHFTFLNFQQVDKSYQNTQWTETIAMWPVEVCVLNFCSTHLILRYQEIINSVQGGLRVKNGVQGNELKKNITKFTRKISFNDKANSFIEMGYKYFSWLFHEIGSCFWHNLAESDTVLNCPVPPGRVKQITAFTFVDHDRSIFIFTMIKVYRTSTQQFVCGVVSVFVNLHLYVTCILFCEPLNFCCNKFMLWQYFV